MNELLRQLAHPMTLTCVLVVLGFGAVAVVSMLVRTASARKELEALRDELPTDLAGSGPGGALSRARIRNLPDGRSLVTERPDQLLEEWLQLHILRLARFDAGGWITGTALFFTFFLIAWVLANDVGPAIEGGGSDGMVSLSRAVRTMGAKFVVSMVGIMMSILHGFGRARCLRMLHTAVSQAAHRLRAAAVSVQDFQVECAEKALEQDLAQLSVVTKSEGHVEQLLAHTAAVHQAVKHQHRETAARIDALTASIEKLQSIEVSVKDIGTGLAASLQQTVKKDIVERICRELQDVGDELRKAFTEAFSASLGTQVAAITDELRKIESAVASQAHSQVEDLLHKLSDAVSGGFATESSRMKDALTRFAEVVPALETQIRSLSRSASDDLAQRSAESGRVSAMLMDRLGHVLEGMERQQQTAVEMGQQMQQFVAQNQGTLTSSLASANEQLAARSQSAADQLTAAMRAATGNAAEVYQSLVGEIDASAKLLRQARADTSEGAQRLHESSALMRESLQRMVELVSSLREVASALGTSAQQARSSVETSSAALRSSSDAVTQHQRFIEELAARWPVLTRQYLEASDQAFVKVASAWKAQAESIGGSVNKIADTFAGSATDFADAVQELGAHFERARGDRTSPTPVRPRG